MVIVYVSRQDKDKTQPVPSLTGRMLEDARNEIKGKFSVRVVEQGQRTASRYRFEPEPGRRFRCPHHIGYHAGGLHRCA